MGFTLEPQRRGQLLAAHQVSLQAHRLVFVHVVAARLPRAHCRRLHQIAIAGRR
jgi:hypothetical protein